MKLGDIAVTSLHWLIDTLLRVRRQSILNAGTSMPGGDRNIAAELNLAIHQLQEEAFDLERGLVDYRRLRNSASYARYRERAASLVDFDLAALWSREEKLAFWINLYNALIIDGIIQYGVRRTVREDLRLFRQAAYVIGGHRYSADDIEHGILRGNRPHPFLKIRQFASNDPRLAHIIKPVDPRVHFALVCGSRSCPPIAVYGAESIDRQLDLATRHFVNSGAVALDARREQLKLSPIFRWYATDFGGESGILQFLAAYLKDGSARRAIELGEPRARLSFQRYDWSLNQA